MPAPPSPEAPRIDPRTQSIWLWQLSLAGVVVLLSLVVLGIAPELFARATTAAGVGLTIAMTVIAMTVPWARVSSRVIALVPLVDVFAIGLLAYGSDLRFGFLWVFPVAWIATHYSVRWLCGILAFIAAIIVVDAVTHEPSAFSTLRFVIVVVSLTFLGITIHTGARKTRAVTRLLRRQTARLQTTLTRVRAQERRVNQMLNGLDAAIARVDRDGRLLGANESLLALYGLDRRDTSRPGSSVEYDVKGGTALREQDRPFARAARGELFSDYRLWLFDAEGTWHALTASTRELAHAPTEPATTLVVITDISDAVSADDARRTLARTVTHELANPLTAIIGYTDLLLAEDLGARNHERLELIDAAGARMETLIAEVLQAGGRERVAEEPWRRVDLGELVAASVESFAPAAAAGDVDIAFGGDEPAPVVADAFRLRQVFDNLISNAVKYTPRAGKVTVDVAPDAGVTIRDTGIGIAAEDLPHIYDDYFRAETARESGRPGTGLGLGIVRGIVEQHEGSLEIASTPGAGTTVTVRLPLAQPEGEIA